MRYVYIYSGMILTFGHKDMPNFRLSANSISEQMHLFQRHNALGHVKMWRNTIIKDIHLHQTTLTFTETRPLIWRGKLLNVLLFLLIFRSEINFCTNFFPRSQGFSPEAVCSDIGGQGQTTMRGGGKTRVAFQVRLFHGLLRHLGWEANMAKIRVNVWDFGPFWTAMTPLQRGGFPIFATTWNSFIDIIHSDRKSVV